MVRYTLAITDLKLVLSKSPSTKSSTWGITSVADILYLLKNLRTCVEIWLRKTS